MECVKQKYGQFCKILNMFRTACRTVLLFWARVIYSLAKNILQWPFRVSDNFQVWNLSWRYRKVSIRADRASVPEDPFKQWWFQVHGIFYVLFDLLHDDGSDLVSRCLWAVSDTGEGCCWTQKGCVQMERSSWTKQLTSSETWLQRFLPYTKLKLPCECKRPLKREPAKTGKGFT